MEAKPGDFLIGVVDLFAILLPGALLLGLLAYAGEKQLIPRLAAIQENAQRWIALLFVFYIFGHFVGIVSPRLLYVYAHAYRPHYGKHIASYQRRSEVLASTYLSEGYQPGDDIQVWAQTIIQLKSASASAVLDRIEADAKFFRGLVVVALLALVLLVWQRKWKMALLCVAFVFLAMASFMDLQVNRETKTYQFFIAIAKAKSSGVEQIKNR